MDPSQPDMVPWSANELRIILEHQLATPLASECARFAEIRRRPLEHIHTLVGDDRGQTFGGLLKSTSPAIAVLALVKDFAKASLSDENDLPREVARVLYIMAILCGRCNSTNPMTSLDRASIERETRRCLTYAWLPDNIRELLRTWMSGIEAR
ncbi:MAG: hypothetical protein GF393_02825 [Armatimonadia bacterium]|nr:hypothetical protein [Armatimonadia bacterium]